MSKIEEIYHDYITSGEYRDGEDVKKKEDEFESALEKEMRDRDKLIELSDLACSVSAARELQGFIHGFKYAVSLMRECV